MPSTLCRLGQKENVTCFSFLIHRIHTWEEGMQAERKLREAGTGYWNTYDLKESSEGRDTGTKSEGLRAWKCHKEAHNSVC